MKQKYLLILGSVIVIGIGLTVTLAHVRSVRSGPQASTPTPIYEANPPQLNPNGTNILPAMPTAVQPRDVSARP